MKRLFPSLAFQCSVANCVESIRTRLALTSTWVLLLAGMSLAVPWAQAENEREQAALKQGAETFVDSALVPDTDGKLEPGEYQTLGSSGSITRAPCPYTCSMRGLSAEHCRMWTSIVRPSECYVQDTRVRASFRTNDS